MNSNIFDDLFNNSPDPIQPKVFPKSYDLPCFHLVIWFPSPNEFNMSCGDSLALAMECFGGMSALYSFKDDPVNALAFKNLYKKNVKALKFGDDDYGFEIYKDDLARELYEKDIAIMTALSMRYEAIRAINKALRDG
jgi:hypothetical protein